jgi:hypothetical protein
MYESPFKRMLTGAGTALVSPLDMLVDLEQREERQVQALNRACFGALAANAWVSEPARAVQQHKKDSCCEMGTLQKKGKGSLDVGRAGGKEQPGRSIGKCMNFLASL